MLGLACSGWQRCSRPSLTRTAAPTPAKPIALRETSTAVTGARLCSRERSSSGGFVLVMTALIDRWSHRRVTVAVSP